MGAPSKVAIVTGAGTGVGRAAALALLKAGYHVTLTGRRIDKLNETAALAVAGESLSVATDVSDVEQVHAMFDQTVAHFGRVDVVFNNAGRGAPVVPLDELDPAIWREVVDINLSGMFYCLQAAFRVMKAQQPMGGRIINNGSVSAHAPRPFSIPYTATKHAVTGLTKSAALDGRAHNIAVGQIDIGNAATPMTERMATGVPQANGDIKEEPLMNVDHVGDAVLQMADLPLDANILNMSIMATKMPWIGRG
jgi:NAD(P)-dependent dehydrogenase (short-subunit alcohol dehydrogenase family)